MFTPIRESGTASGGEMHFAQFAAQIPLAKADIDGLLLYGVVSPAMKPAAPNEAGQEGALCFG
ncbi:hypothetical protein LB542_19955 [Mesorhizobium sp. BR1-1-9]|uniref:hypothetical protein n=1 Tax=Mesorhizobium sp. BR1-1-9 TaxID=2876646 RepID=UPI001CD1470E|nr:hypothetical protein [Mesorhizobium sp. BR1-1-9]MBZ9873126.1 hypothetical protein [Mesorhizobium sp. BR1-1-9]